MSEITMEMARCDDVLERMVPSDVRQLIGRAEKAEARVKELEATLKTLASQAMYALKKGDWKNETL